MKKIVFALFFTFMFGKTFSQLTVVEWNFPGLGTSVANIASTMPNNVGKTLITLGGTGAVGYGTNVGAYTQSAWCNGWAAGSGLKWWEIEFSTFRFIQSRCVIKTKKFCNWASRF